MLGVPYPTSTFVPESAWLLFLAMPMLTVGGILFLLTNLQVGLNPKSYTPTRNLG